MKDSVNGFGTHMQMSCVKKNLLNDENYQVVFHSFDISARNATSVMQNLCQRMYQVTNSYNSAKYRVKNIMEALYVADAPKLINPRRDSD